MRGNGRKQWGEVAVPVIARGGRDGSGAEGFDLSGVIFRETLPIRMTIPIGVIKAYRESFQ